MNECPVDKGLRGIFLFFQNYTLCNVVCNFRASAFRD